MKGAILADIGGTYARFAMLRAGAPERIEKRALADFSSLQDAAEQYRVSHEIGRGDLYIATAAWPYPDGVWRFAREGRWEIAPSALEKAGWRVAHIGNDFAAGARGAVSLPPEHLYALQPKKDDAAPAGRASVLGAGTGLGLAYVPADGGAVQETYGGHMEVAQRTDEQHMIVKIVRRLKGNDGPVSAEDILSGSGLSFLYAAVCLVHGRKPAGEGPEAVLADGKSAPSLQALRLFHEFLGLFAHQAALYGHAYAGLFLDGGVIHRLVEADAFDARTFLDFLIGDPLPLIRDRLCAMPVNIVTDPYVTLRGLAAMAGDHAA